VESPQSDVVALATAKTLYVINKNPLRRRITVETDTAGTGKASGEVIGMKHQVVMPVDVQADGGRLFFFAEPFSFTMIRIQP
jgi:hypothetical protein